MCVPERLLEHIHMQWNPSHVRIPEILVGEEIPLDACAFCKSCTSRVLCALTSINTQQVYFSERTEVLLLWTTEVVRSVTTKNSHNCMI